MLATLQGFTPDLDQTLEGVITGCQNYLPSLRGMEAAPSAQATSLPALAAACQGAASMLQLDSTVRLIAGTGTKLYEAATSSWTDVSRAAGGAYTLTSDGRWRFCQYGNVALATNGADSLQYSTGVGLAFANVTGTPRGKVIDTAVSFVLLGNYNDGSDVPHGVWWSALGNYADWTPSPTTQAGKILLTQTPGEIRALKALGDLVVVYKAGSMYLGAYGGSPQLWTFSLISSSVGAPSQEAVVPIVLDEAGGFAHIFMGSNDFYLFAGSQPAPLGGSKASPVREYVFSRLNSKYAFKSFAIHDPTNTRVYFYYPSTSSTDGTPDSCVVYNYKSHKWGSDDRSVEFAVQYVTGSMTYNDASALYATYADFPSTISYGSPFWVNSRVIPAFFNTSHVLNTLDGAPGSCSMTFGDVGEDSKMSTMIRVRPRWRTRPASASLSHYYRMDTGDALSTGPTANLTSGHFDFMQSAKWHRISIQTTGTSEYGVLQYEGEPDGLE